MTKTKIYRLAVVLTLVITCFSLCACCDLGDFGDTDEYYALCPKVYLMKQNLGQTNYDMEDMYNPKTVEDLECPMDTNMYRYLSIRFTENTDLKEIAFFLHGDADVDMKIFVFVMATIPVAKSEHSTGTFNMKYLAEDGRYFDFDLDEDDETKGIVHYFNGREGSPTVDYRFTTSGDNANAFDGDDHRIFQFDIVEGGIQVIKYRVEDGIIEYKEFFEVEIEDEPLLSNAIASFNVHLHPDSWSSFRIDRWNIDGVEERQVNIPTNNYIVFRFDNNCPGAVAKMLTPCSFKATNVLIRK